jgi:hypothetical protein
LTLGCPAPFTRPPTFTCGNWVTDRRKIFHSFRDGYEEACRAAGEEEAIFDAL